MQSLCFFFFFFSFSFCFEVFLQLLNMNNTDVIHSWRCGLFPPLPFSMKFKAAVGGLTTMKNLVTCSDSRSFSWDLDRFFFSLFFFLLYLQISLLKINHGLSHSQIPLHSPWQVKELCSDEFEDLIDIDVVGCT